MKRHPESMLAKEAKRLPELVKKLLEPYGAVEQEDASLDPTYVVPTRAGTLRVHPDPESWGDIFCRFESVELARPVIGTGPASRLNPYSGKWNFHYGRVTAEEAVEDFARAFRGIAFPLDVRSCIHCGNARPAARVVAWCDACLEKRRLADAGERSPMVPVTHEGEE